MLDMDAHATELEMPPRLNGRAPARLEVAYVRDLTSADVSLLGTERGIKAPNRKRLRDRHHSLARCLAQGMKPWEASAVTGYSPSTISILQADPTFVELVAFYAEHEDAALAEFSQRASLVTLTALNNLQEIVENDEEPLTLEQNLTVVKTLADRTGHAPVQRAITTNLNVDISGKLAAAKSRLAALAQRRLPEPEPIEAVFTEIEVETDGGP
jgi:hypothetical protein